MLKLATGGWCQYCPGAALGADDLFANGCSVAIIENHNGDPYAYAASDARNTYYGIKGYPTAVFDGQQQFVGGDHTVSNVSSIISPFMKAGPRSIQLIHSVFSEIIPEMIII